MERTNKHTVLKEVRNTGAWFGYIASSKISAYHIDGGWHLGCDVLITQGRNGIYYVVNSLDGTYEELISWLSTFRFYNCDSERGTRIAFWVA